MKCNREVCARAWIVAFVAVACELSAVALQVPATDTPDAPIAQQNPAKPDQTGQNTKARRGEPDDDDKPVDPGRLHNAILWHDPGPIRSLDLFNGQDGHPLSPFQFVSEDMKGTNPKFDVTDANGTRWRVKLGDEARPEVVASRLLWAVGYFVNDDYLIPSAEVQGLQLTRGATLAADGHIDNARFEKRPEGEKKIGIWRWDANPFLGSREFNGLRVMMAVINNWDLKDVNNAVYADERSGKQLFLTSDIGATFGTNGLSWSKSRSKGDVATFEKSKFITRKNDNEVDFGTPAAPNPVLAANIGRYQKRRDLEWIGKKIPIAHARWIGSLLKQLTHQQLVDAFRAGHFELDEIEKYVKVLQDRIDELAAL